MAATKHVISVLSSTHKEGYFVLVYNESHYAEKFLKDGDGFRLSILGRLLQFKSPACPSNYCETYLSFNHTCSHKSILKLSLPKNSSFFFF